MSENIRVKSLLGRFLEHSRVFHFKNAPNGKRTFLGSPDWMPRNFFRRIEVVFPIEQNEEEQKILASMQSFLDDNEYATELKVKGNYANSPKRRKSFSAQEHFISETKLEIAEQEKANPKKTLWRTQEPKRKRSGKHLIQ